ncbi:SAM-dependent methyltransferase [Actinomadura sp. 9N407]|uniref:SAM-dependent methyltransferase n=1 Tax=Actinomadura sp. 9N407 TaxID=3375154 RepID=UPI0037B12321
MTDPDPPAPRRAPLDFTVPTSTRMSDFALGGKDNFKPDRAIAQRLLETLPALSLLPRENRKFMRRAVRHLLAAGVRQFVDVGCGLPGKGNVHQIVHGTDPDGTVVYVDHDPVAVVHFQALLHQVRGATAVRGDARDPAAILRLPEVTALIDFDRPVGVLMCGVLSQIRDEEDPEGVVAAFRDAMAPGGHLALCDITADGMPAEDLARTESLLQEAGLVSLFRGRERITGFFDGFELLEPGVVPSPDWRPDRPYDPPSGRLLAAVARKP